MPPRPPHGDDRSTSHDVMASSPLKRVVGKGKGDEFDNDPATTSGARDQVDQVDSSPDSPTSRLMNRLAAIHMDTANAASDQGAETPRFSYRTHVRDVAPELAKQAKSELQQLGGDPSSSWASSRELDIGRQQEVFEALEQDTRMEKQLNDELASVVVGRLEAAKSCAEKILSVLQALATAERAYSKSLKAIGALKLTGDADGATLHQALTDFVELPSRVGAAHEKSTESSQPPINLVRDLVAKLRESCTNMKQGSLRVEGDVDRSVKALKTSVEAHREVCKAFDALSDASKNAKSKLSSQKTRSIETDPWIAEGRIVERQAALRTAQASQRKYLATSFARVGELEQQRITVTSTALSNAVETMMCSIASDLQEAADAALASLSAIDGDADLSSFNSMARDIDMSSRQVDLIDYLWRQVERSSEIVRQGPVKRLVGCSWTNGHAVLTRAGFLHWFKTETEEEWSFGSGPTVSMNLPRCDFELGDAPSWRLTESTAGAWWGSKVHGQTMSTADVDSCMEWTASLKETIQGYVHMTVARLHARSLTRSRNNNNNNNRFQ